MAEEQTDWVGTRIGAALEVVSVPEGTADVLRTAMRGEMASKRLTAGELSQLARNLLGSLNEGEE